MQHTPFNSSFTLYRGRSLVVSIEEGDFIIINFEPFKLLMNFFALTTNYSNCSCLSNQSNHEIETSITNEGEGRKTVNVEQNGNRNVLLMILFILKFNDTFENSRFREFGYPNVNGILTFFELLNTYKKHQKQ